MGEEFQSFLKQNGVKHPTSAPHHPATNGLAERFVQSFKQSMKASGKDGTVLQQKVANFLLAYRNTAHATTGQTPAMLFMGRNLRSRLDLLKPDIRKHVLEKQCSTGQTQKQLRTFSVGHKVLARDYRGNNQKWQPGEILSQSGPLSYTVRVGADIVCRRHIDQLRDATAKTAANESAAHQDSDEFTPCAPDDFETDNDIDPEPQLRAAEEPRRNPERNRRAPQRLDL